MKIGDKVRVVGTGLDDLEEYANKDGVIVGYHPGPHEQWPYDVRFENKVSLTFAFADNELVEIK